MREARVLAKAEMTLAGAVEHWLVEFERALVEGDRALLESLFHPESYWRDLLAFTWEIGTVCGAEAIAARLTACAGEAAPTRFEVDPERTPPRRVTRAGTAA